MNKKLIEEIEKIMLKTEAEIISKHGVKATNKDKAQAIAKSLMINKDKTRDIMPPLTDKFFPKGKCAERGQAIMLVAMIANKLFKADLIEVKEIKQ